jgi:S1-C subfamily serine protease
MVEIDDTDGGLAMAGLKSGDLVIGVDGEEFKDETDLRARWMTAAAKETARLIVLRGAKRIEIVADLTKLRGREAGGTLRTTTR